MKIDFKKELKELYAPSAKEFSIVEVPCFRFFMIDGAGDPNTSPDYVAAIETLYAAAYATKFACKNELDRDYVVPPLEGLWWADDMEAFTSARDKSMWKWTMMIMIPDLAPEKLIEMSVKSATEKKNPPAIEKLRVETLTEGLCVQIMHVGSYEAEAATLKRLHSEHMPAKGLVADGRHHEIYISDPRKTVPEKLKTVLRQPVRTT